MPSWPLCQQYQFWDTYISFRPCQRILGEKCPSYLTRNGTAWSISWLNTIASWHTLISLPNCAKTINPSIDNCSVSAAIKIPSSFNTAKTLMFYVYNLDVFIRISVPKPFWIKWSWALPVNNVKTKFSLDAFAYGLILPFPTIANFYVSCYCDKDFRWCITREMGQRDQYQGWVEIIWRLITKTYT